MNLVDVETEWKFPIPPPPPPPPNEEEENEVMPPPPIGPNGVKPTEMTMMMMMMMMMFKYTSMPNIPRRTSCYQWFFTSYTQINKPASNPEKGDPNGENPGKNEPVVLLLLTPLWRRPPKKSSKGSSAKSKEKVKNNAMAVHVRCVRIKWSHKYNLSTTEQQIYMLDRQTTETFTNSIILYYRTKESIYSI